MHKLVNLNNSEEISKHIFLDNFLEYIWIIDFNTNKFSYISPSFANLNNLIIDDFLSKNFLDLFTKDSKDRLIKVIQENFPEIPEDSQELEEEINFIKLGDFELALENNKILHLEISVKYFLDLSKNVPYVLFSAFDITNRKIKEEILNKELYRKTLFIEDILTKEKELQTSMEKLKEENQKLHNISITDKLTGIYNRQFFESTLIQEVNRSKRYNENLSMIFFDIDHFKKVNDTYGHKSGDDVLKRISSLIKNSVRNSDMLSRWGGEEFIILLPNTSLNIAAKLAEKLREIVEKEKHPDVGSVTSSFAVSQLLKKEDINTWFLRLDSLLYEAKNAGRNCVKVSHEVEESVSPLLTINWKDEWNSGNKAIDIQHRFLINHGNRIIQSVLTNQSDIKEKLEELLVHTKYHFNYEERFLQEINYSEYENHKKLHRVLLNKAIDLFNKFNNNSLNISDILDFYINILIIGHIEKEDRKFFFLIE